jgi:hypothetical protein
MVFVPRSSPIRRRGLETVWRRSSGLITAMAGDSFRALFHELENVGIPGTKPDTTAPFFPRKVAYVS